MAVTMRIEYLPDYNEEYSIRVTPGLGQASLKVSLQNGWNLNSVDEATDQRYAEIIGSVASLVKAATLADNVPTYQGVADYDVPLGFYEAVIAADACGSRQLIGWRYVGFAMGFACPVKAYTNLNSIECDGNVLFGLVFKNGTLRFQKMADFKFGRTPVADARNESPARNGEDEELEQQGPDGKKTLRRGGQ